MTPLWTPSPERVAQTELARFMKLAGKSSYAELHRWSVEHSEEFWELVWKFGQVRGEPGQRRVVNPGRMPGAKWFPDGRLNYAEHALYPPVGVGEDGVAVIFAREDGRRRRLTWRELRTEVAAVRAALVRFGVGRGDRVVALLPNAPEALIAMLATASLGAVWSSCSPDFGARAIADRFAQIEPTVLLTVDGYRYGGKAFDVRDTVADLRGQLPTVTTTVLVPYLDDDATLPDSVRWPDLIAAGAAHALGLAFEPIA